MSDSLPTEQQEDSGVRRGTHGRGAIGHLRVVFGKSPRVVHEVRGVGTIIGRNPGDAIQIDDGRMSRQHVRVEHGPAGWQLVDLGSRNGGFIDGRGFRPNVTVPIADGALLRLGDSLMVFRASQLDDWHDTSEVFPGVSPAAVAVRRRLAALAASPGHVLVLGETGTGKERVARALADSRKDAPFVTQNCAELTHELARSELFGHQRGAFSGATQTKQGLVDLAGDGVLFLDEVGELALDVQGDLLRYLEDGSYRPLGSVELPPQRGAGRRRHQHRSRRRRREQPVSPRPRRPPARQQRADRAAAVARTPRGPAAVGAGVPARGRLHHRRAVERRRAGMSVAVSVAREPARAARRDANLRRRERVDADRE